jgi:hypothetical protein
MKDKSRCLDCAGTIDECKCGEKKDDRFWGGKMKYIYRTLSFPFVLIGYLGTLIGCVIAFPFWLWDVKCREAREWWWKIFY